MSSQLSSKKVGSKAAELLAAENFNVLRYQTDASIAKSTFCIINALNKGTSVTISEAIAREYALADLDSQHYTALASTYRAYIAIWKINDWGTSFENHMMANKYEDSAKVLSIIVEHHSRYFANISDALSDSSYMEYLQSRGYIFI
jgi:hypothetical protein